jgi:hypothetical protein
VAVSFGAEQGERADCRGFGRVVALGVEDGERVGEPGLPFGNCTEPSNVKAGGGACPIRFQRAGCGFYRPDPSYLPALEQHIAGLRADRETARAIGAADYVLASLTAEIDAFTAVAEAMHRKLSELDPAQRAEVEEASRILRRARALPPTDITSRTTETA